MGEKFSPVVQKFLLRPKKSCKEKVALLITLSNIVFFLDFRYRFKSPPCSGDNN